MARDGEVNDAKIELYNALKEFIGLLYRKIENDELPDLHTRIYLEKEEE